MRTIIRPQKIAIDIAVDGGEAGCHGLTLTRVGKDLQVANESLCKLSRCEGCGGFDIGDLMQKRILD